LAGASWGIRENRLLRYDAQIAINATRATFFRWHDRLIAATMLAIAIAVVRSRSADCPWPIAAWTGCGCGLILGIIGKRLVDARLSFHALHGLLAADALLPSTSKSYKLAWHAILLTGLTILTLVARPSLLIVSLPAYLIGTLVGHLVENLAQVSFMTKKIGLGRFVQSWLQRPLAGLIGAMILVASLQISAHYFGRDALVAVAGIEAAMLSLALTVVDDSLVRFKTVSGHSSGRIVMCHARGELLLMGITAPICLIAFGPHVAGAVAGVSIAAMLLLAIRILAYRLYGRRLADLLVSCLVGLTMMAAFSMPVLLPFAIILTFWQLRRRADALTWVLP